MVKSLTGMTAAETALFNAGHATFSQFTSVNGTFVMPAGVAPGKGLGPRFNHDQCGDCHVAPAHGGASAPFNTQASLINGLNTDYGIQAPGQTNPPFLKPDGPSLAVRFKYNADGTRDGSVHQLFTISGRPDAPGCSIPQPDFAGALAKNNVAIRITTPTMGAGLIENIPDANILANKNASLQAKNILGIHGHENRNSAALIAKFGWKAQTRTLNEFSADAFSHEMGVTSLSFPNQNDPDAVCDNLSQGIEDMPVASPAGPMTRTDLVSVFMRFLAPPAALYDNASRANGRTLFTQVGCNMCHTPAMYTGPSTSAALSYQQVALFSDLLVHKMGPGLADDVIQGLAGPDEFRTAPLWGLGQRIFFLHDGRTKDLRAAIDAHASAGNAQFGPSEANKVISNWSALTEAQKQDLLNFLRGL